MQVTTIFVIRNSLERYLFPKTEANAIVHVVKKVGLKAIEPHSKPLCETLKIQFVCGTEEILSKRELFEIRPKGSQGLQARRKRMKCP